MSKSLFLIPILLLAPLTTSAAAIPPRPEQIEFAPLQFDPPLAADYHHTLPNGVSVYLAPSHEFPLINLALTFQGGQYLESPEQIGLAVLTGALMRQGGSETMSAEEMDEALDFLAANVSIGCGGTTSSASLNSLASNFEESFARFMDLVRHPGFQQDRLDLVRDQTIERMKRRNDDASSILRREWSAFMYGREHFEARQATAAMVQSITHEDLSTMHRRIFHPGNLTIAVTGDFDPQAMLKMLEQTCADWPVGETAPAIPAPTHKITPGVYHLEKDIPQGKVRIGMRSLQRDDPDFFPMLVMNNILGGGGFTSRITNRVRSDEGLAYSAGSRFRPGVHYPGAIAAAFDSKNRTVALACKIIYEEIDRIRNEPVSEEELETAKNSFIETFPRTFESKPGMLSVFVSDEITNRSPDYWVTYRDRVKSVTAQSIQNVAQKHLNPDQLAIFIVGNWDEIYPGDLEGRATMSEFHQGDVTHLPLRDPMTLKPIE